VKRHASRRHPESRSIARRQRGIPALLAQSQELEKLRQDNADLKRLRGETAQLHAQLPEVEKNYEPANQKLQAQISNDQPAGTNPNDDFFAQQKAKLNPSGASTISSRSDWLADFGHRISRLLNRGTPTKDYAGILPPDFLNMTNELGVAEDELSLHT